MIFNLGIPCPQLGNSSIMLSVLAIRSNGVRNASWTNNCTKLTLEKMEAVGGQGSQLGGPSLDRIGERRQTGTWVTSGREISGKKKRKEIPDQREGIDQTIKN